MLLTRGTVVPITRTHGEGVLYPALGPGASGLRTRSYTLVDQIRSVDKKRITRAFCHASDEELRMIDEELHPFLGLR